MWRCFAVVMCGLGLGGCRADPNDHLLLEVTAPLHVALRVADNADDSCGDVSGAARVSCLLGLLHRGCLYLEVADAPSDGGSPCGLPAFGERVAVGRAEGRDLRLGVDPAGERVALQVGNTSSVYYLEQGWVGARVTLPRPLRWPIDWASIEPTDAHLGELYANATGERRTRLVRRMTADGGEAGMVASLVASWQGDYDDWDERFRALSDGGQDQVREKLEAGLRVTDGGFPQDAWEFLVNHPALQTPRFLSTLRALVANPEPLLGQGNELDWAIEELYRQSDHDAGVALSCEVLRLDYVRAVFASRAPDQEVAFHSVPALATLVDLAAPCPWIPQWLVTFPCSVPMSCPFPADGGVLDPLRTAPMGRCTPRHAAAALARWKVQLPRPVPPPDAGQEEAYAEAAADGGEDEAVVFEASGVAGDVDVSPGLVEDTAPLFVRALEQLGSTSLPAYTQSLRGTYQLVDPAGAPMRTPICSPASEGAALVSALCAVPVSVTELRGNNCLVRIDDKARRVTLKSFGPGRAPRLE